MLNFLNTAVLLAAVAALLPFLLHLFSRRKVKVIPFSSITYLKAMQKRQVRAIKIRQVLLLLIRTLIVLAVVLAFARPALRGGYLGAHASVTAAIIVDNSASMGLTVKDGRLFDLAQKRAKEIVDQMGPADEVAVRATVDNLSSSLDDAYIANLFGNAAQAGEQIGHLTVSDGRGNLVDKLNQTIDLVKQRPNLNREVYIISDFQQSGFDPEQLAGDFDGRIFLVGLPRGEIDNNSVIALDFGNQMLEAGTPFELKATFKKRSGVSEEEVLASVYVDGQRVDQRGIYLDAGASQTVNFNLVVSKPGFHSGYVALSDDDLLADNARFFSFYIPDNFNILLVGQGTDNNLIRLALSPDESIRRHWSVKNLDYNDLASAVLNQYDVVVLTNFSSLPQGVMGRLVDFVRRGGGLLLNLGRDADTAHFNKYWTESTDLKLLSEFPREFSRSGYFLLSDFDHNHQILNVFKEIAADEPLQFRSFVRLKSELSDNNSAQILARWSDGSPSLITASLDRGRVMVFNCDISPEFCDISMHPFFVPFMIRSVEYLSGDFAAHVESIQAGASPVRTLRFGFNINNQYSLVYPDGSKSFVEGRFENDLKLVETGSLDRTGLYSLYNDAREIDRMAVNIDPDEGDLYRMEKDNLAELLPGALWLEESINAAGFIDQSRFGRELWQYFLIAALLLMALEMAVARDRGITDKSD